MHMGACRGFYRGFGTVVFGTIPARSVYLTTLEVTKATVTRLGEHLDISSPALAGAASFMGGAAASASTQAVVVPIDVISQRLMMHGVDNNGSSSRVSSAAAAAGSSRGQPVQPPLPQEQRQPQQAVACSSSSQQVRAGGAGGPAAAPVQAPAGQPGAAAGHQQPGRRGLHTSTHPSSGSRSSTHIHAVRAAHLQRMVSSQLPRLPHQHLQQQSWQHIGSALGSSCRRSPQQELLQQPCRVQPRQLSSVAAVQQPMNGFHMARLIIQQEGVRGLYRGFWPSLATFVPNSAMWWGAYGFYQRLLWEQLPSSWTQPQTNDSSSSGGLAPSTGVVVAVQTTASVLSGCTASVLTNPLDLVKTRLQVLGDGSGRGTSRPSSCKILRSSLHSVVRRAVQLALGPAVLVMWVCLLLPAYMHYQAHPRIVSVLKLSACA